MFKTSQQFESYLSRKPRRGVLVNHAMHISRYVSHESATSEVNKYFNKQEFQRTLATRRLFLVANVSAVINLTSRHNSPNTVAKHGYRPTCCELGAGLLAAGQPCNVAYNMDLTSVSENNPTFNLRMKIS